MALEAGIDGVRNMPARRTGWRSTGQRRTSPDQDHPCTTWETGAQAAEDPALTLRTQLHKYNKDQLSLTNRMFFSARTQFVMLFITYFQKSSLMYQI